MMGQYNNTARLFILSINIILITAGKYPIYLIFSPVQFSNIIIMKITQLVTGAGAFTIV